MAYRRRYFPPLTITTIALPADVIVEDKIADGAVTHPKIAPDAVDSESVIDESLEGKDIKDATIEGRDVKDATLEGKHLKNATIPQSKLDFTPSARPLVPGISTDEVLDNAITKAKLAPNSVGYVEILPGSVRESELDTDAVTESKIKDGEISTSKYKPSSVDDVALKWDSVGGTEIKTGAVGETELGTDSVVTVKVKDENITLAKMAPDSVDASKILADSILTVKVLDKNITEPKLADDILAKRHIEKFYDENRVFYDDFFGAVLDNRWAQAGDAGGIVSLATDNVYLTTGAGSGDAWRIHWNSKYNHTFVSSKPKFSTRLRGSIYDYVRNIVGLYQDSDNYIAFRAEDAVGATPTWKAVCRAGGAETVIDTGITMSDLFKLLKIDYIAENSVKFYIDGVEKAHITTNVPNDMEFEVYFECKTNAAAYRQLTIDHALLLGTRA